MSGNAWGESWGIVDSFAWGDSWGFEGFVPPVVTPPAPAVVANDGVGRRAWASYYRRTLPKKKRDLLDELDDYLVELKARVQEAPAEQVATEKLVQRVENFTLNAELADLTEKRIRGYLNQVQAAIEEMDDEEAILLAIH